MVIDMNEARLDTLGQIREFLPGTADIAFFDHGGPGGSAPLRRQGAAPTSILQAPQRPSRGAVRLHAAADRLYPTAPDQAGRPVSAGTSLAPAYASQSDQLQ